MAGALDPALQSPRLKPVRLTALRNEQCDRRLTHAPVDLLCN